MSGVFINTGPEDVVRVWATTHTDGYAVAIGTTTIALPPAKAAEVRDALTAALADPEETPNGH